MRHRCLPAIALATLVLVVMGHTSGARAEEDRSGRYVQLQVRTLAVKAPVLGSFKMVTRVVSLHDVKHEGSRLRGGGTLCAIDVTSETALATTELPSAFRRVASPPTIDARLLEVDSELRLVSTKQTVVLGAKLDDEAEDDLPTSASDARVFDEDDDGKPGVTVRVGGLLSGKLYLVQRTWTKLIGRHAGSGFRGRLVFGVDQSVLGGSKSVLTNQPEMKPLANLSSFRLERVDNALTCKKAIELVAKWEP